MNHIKWIYDVWKNHKKYVVLLVFITLLSTTVAVSYPFVFKLLFDVLSSIISNPENFPSPQREINKIVWLIMGIGFIRLISGIYPALRAYMNLKFEYALRKEYFEYILKKDYTFFSKFRTGDLVTRLTEDLSDFPKICWFLCSGLFRAFDSLSKIVFCILVMFLLNWKLTILSIAPIPFMIIIFYITSNKLYHTFKKNQEAISEINNQLEMSFSGIRIIKSFVCEEKYNRFFQEALSQRFTTEIAVVKLNAVIELIYEYIDRFAQIMVIIFGGYMVVSGDITIGTFYAFYTYLSILIYPILDLPQLFVSGRQSFVNIDRLEEIKNFPEIKKYSKEKIQIENIEEIKFDNVEFAYPDEKPIIENMDFTVKKGEKVVIVGPVGSGKTTILGLLAGLTLPTKGNIFINNINIEEIDTKFFRKKIGFVPQEPLLFSGTIKENVGFAIDEMEEEFYKKIIEMVQMDNEISSFKDKDLTKIGQRGISLSGGQKQRISIARALMKKPQILILDDITASLDSDNEKNLWHDINEVYKSITCFIVSHRLSTIKYADNVIFLMHGKIFEKDAHSVLFQKHPEYRTFVEKHYMKDD